nr:PREDICTED: putative COBW domain-containing protein 7 isoform X1 [Haliaeetus albicilla]
MWKINKSNTVLCVEHSELLSVLFGSCSKWSLLVVLGIITVTFEVPGNIKEENLNLFIQNLLWEKNVKDKTGHTMDIIRLKGLVSIQGKSHQVIVQGVHELYDLEETAVAWKENEKRTNRLVLIGRNLDKETIKEVFIATVREKQGIS